MHSPIRQSAVAGTWYPASPAALASTIDGYLAAVQEPARFARVHAIIVPHAGLMYSGSVAAHAYRILDARAFDLVVLVGPAHAGGFEGAVIWDRGGFRSPFGVADIDEVAARALAEAAPLVRAEQTPHIREHSLELQLPFLQRVAPHARILPVLMGWQTAATARALGAAIAATVRGRQALLVASSDLSHYHDATTADQLDGVVRGYVEDFDPDGLQSALDRNPHHACGGGPMVAVMRAARELGARDAEVLAYADSGDVSGDKSSVVGYVAAVLGNR